MTSLAVISNQAASLPALVDRASRALAGARTSAEILEARELAGVAYDAAKKSARLAAAKGAFNALVAASNRAQADALEIEAMANRRLADEYDAAQERNEVAKAGKPVIIPDGNNKAKVAEIGLSSKAIHYARIVRDAEEADPGIVRRTLDEAIEAEEEPTRAKVKRAVQAKSKRTRSPRRDPNSPADTQHDRDLRMLLGVWESACQSARVAFMKAINEA